MQSQHPVLRRLSNGDIAFDRSEEARRYIRDNANRHHRIGRPHEQVHGEAVRAAAAMGLVRPSEEALRGFYQLQFGIYQGLTFRWVAENDIGWATYLVCKVESEGGNTGAGALNDNKRHFRVSSRVLACRSRALLLSWPLCRMAHGLFLPLAGLPRQLP